MPPAEISSRCRIRVLADRKIRYTVPQFITRREDCTLYFRVADRYRNVKINILAGDRLLHSVRRPKAVPGEMESILLKKELLGDFPEIRLELEESIT